MKINNGHLQSGTWQFIRCKNYGKRSECTAIKIFQVFAGAGILLIVYTARENLLHIYHKCIRKMLGVLKRSK